MSENGLEAFRKITTTIANQDEEIWRQSAAKKCLKKEIEKLNEQSKSFEQQIATLQKNPLYEKYEENSKLLEDNIKEHLQTHKLLSLAISAKTAEIERLENHNRSWEIKYAEAIEDLREAYELKKKSIEVTNPAFKKLKELEVAEKVAKVRLNQLKASEKSRIRSQKQSQEIQQKIFHTTIVKFVREVQRNAQCEALDAKMKMLREKKKEMVKTMIEAQEALKKLKIRNTQIPSGMFTNRSPNFQLPGNSMRNDRKRMIELPPMMSMKPQNPTTMGKLREEYNLKADEERKQTISSLTPKKNTSLPPKGLKIISSQTLPPLKSILTMQRSRMDISINKSLDTSFNKSQNSQIHSQPETPKKSQSTPKQSQEENSNMMEPPQISKIIKSSDFLKNLKFTGQSNKFQTPKRPTSISVPLAKNSILKSPNEKRKLTESGQDYDLDSSFKRREKNVNFASPIQQNIEPNQTYSEGNSDLSTHPDEVSEMNMSNLSFEENNENLNMSAREVFKIDNSQFNFGNEIAGSDGNGPTVSSVPFFGGKSDTKSTFGFNFGSQSGAGDDLDFFG